MFPEPVSSDNRGARGFTLVEALVALALLTVGLIPAFIQATNALALSTSVRNSLTAANLAQEGAEITRAIRDANWLTGQPFNTGLDSCAAGCTVQFDGDAPVVGSFMGVPLNLDPTTGLYQYGSGTNSGFTRTVFITDEAPHHLKVLVVIEWAERSGPKKFELEYHLYDWAQ